LIREHTGRIKWFVAELRTETDPTRRAKLTKNLEIKRRRVAELRRAVQARPLVSAYNGLL
jgi:hypothetical protein